MRRPMVLATVLAVGAGIGLGSATGAVASQPDSPAPASTSTAALPASTHVVTLLTGDHVRIGRTRDGHTLIEGIPQRHAGIGGDFQTVRAGSDVYVIPMAARPYLDTVLDPSVFDVSSVHRAPGARIPVRIDYRGGAVPHVPGVTVTSHRLGFATGYLTPRSAVRFGTALVRRYRALAAHGFRDRHTLFGATHIGVAGDSAPSSRVRPDYPMRTLIVHVVNGKGKPVRFGSLSVLDSADLGKYVGFSDVIDGEARVSVPVGTYTIQATVNRPSHTGPGGFGVLTTTGVTVSKQDTEVRMNSAKATSLVSVKTPQPADVSVLDFEIGFSDPHGRGFFDSGFALLGGGSLYVQPVSDPNISTSTSWTLTGTPTTGESYSYSLTYTSANGIAKDQSNTATPADLASFDSHYYVDEESRDGSVLTYPMSPGQEIAGGWSSPLTLPTNNITYVNAAPKTLWYTSLFASPNPFVNPFAGTIDDVGRRAPAGSVLTADWARGPAWSQIPSDVGGGAFTCPSCRTDSTMLVGFDLATDTTPGHAWETFARRGTPAVHLAVYRDGKLLAKRTNSGVARVSVPKQDSTYRIVESVNRKPSLALQSTLTKTALTFRSAASDPGTLPSGWHCSLKGSCSTLSLLDTAVDLPTNFVGNIGRGTSQIGLRVGHVAGSTEPAITSGTVQVRVHGAAKWIDLPISPGAPGVYAATLKTRPGWAGKAFDLRVTGTDAAGGKIVQTAFNAFSVTAS